jgi:hypothetical protein
MFENCLARRNGGAMAESEVDSGSKQGGQGSGGGAGKRLNPENGSTGAAGMFRGVVEAIFRDNPEAVKKCILFHLDANNLKAVELLMNMAARWGSGEDVSAEDYQSLAEMLMEACKEQGVEVAG